MSPQKKQIKIVLADVDKKFHEKVKALAEKEKRTIAKQVEYLAQLAIDQNKL